MTVCLETHGEETSFTPAQGLIAGCGSSLHRLVCPRKRLGDFSVPVCGGCVKDANLAECWRDLGQKTVLIYKTLKTASQAEVDFIFLNLSSFLISDFWILGTSSCPRVFHESLACGIAKFHCYVIYC